MTKITQYARISHHTIAGTAYAGKTFSVPTSEDFTDGTWDEYDLALSEIGVNEEDCKVFIRIDNDIKEFQLVGGTSGNPSLSQVLSVGNTTDGTDIELSSGDEITSNKSIVLSPFGEHIIRVKNSSQQIITKQDNQTTTDATPIVLGGVSGISVNMVGMTSSVTIDVTVQAMSGANGYGSRLFGVFKSVGGTVTQIGTTTKDEKSNFTTATSDFLISGSKIFIEVTGEAATTIEWNGSMTYKILDI